MANDGVQESVLETRMSDEETCRKARGTEDGGSAWWRKCVSDVAWRLLRQSDMTVSGVDVSGGGGESPVGGGGAAEGGDGDGGASDFSDLSAVVKSPSPVCGAPPATTTTATRETRRPGGRPGAHWGKQRLSDAKHPRSGHSGSSARRCPHRINRYKVTEWSHVRRLDITPATGRGHAHHTAVDDVGNDKEIGGRPGQGEGTREGSPKGQKRSKPSSPVAEGGRNDEILDSDDHRDVCGVSAVIDVSARDSGDTSDTQTPASCQPLRHIDNYHSSRVTSSPRDQNIADIADLDSRPRGVNTSETPVKDSVTQSDLCEIGRHIDNKRVAPALLDLNACNKEINETSVKYLHNETFSTTAQSQLPPSQKSQPANVDTREPHVTLSNLPLDATSLGLTLNFIRALKRDRFTNLLVCWLLIHLAVSAGVGPCWVAQAALVPSSSGSSPGPPPGPRCPCGERRLVPSKTNNSIVLYFDPPRLDAFRTRLPWHTKQNVTFNISHFDHDLIAYNEFPKHRARQQHTTVAKQPKAHSQSTLVKRTADVFPGSGHQSRFASGSGETTDFYHIATSLPAPFNISQTDNETKPTLEGSRVVKKSSRKRSADEDGSTDPRVADEEDDVHEEVAVYCVMVWTNDDTIAAPFLYKHVLEASDDHHNCSDDQGHYILMGVDVGRQYNFSIEARRIGHVTMSVAVVDVNGQHKMAEVSLAQAQTYLLIHCYIYSLENL